MALASFRVLSELVERAKLMRRAGITHDGKRDMYDVLGYKLKLSLEDYWSRYERGGIAARIVEVLPETTWRGGAIVMEVEDPATTTKFEGEFEKLAERLSLWSHFEHVDSVSGVGEFAVLIIGADGEATQPLPAMSNTDNIGYVQVYSQREIDWDKMQAVKDRKDPRYGWPEFYSLKEDRDKMLAQQQVHWTRVIHVPSDKPTGLFGVPRLRAVWNYIDDLEKVVGGGAEAGWQQANPITQFDIDKDLKVDVKDENLKAMQDQVDELVHNLRRYIRTRGVTMHTREAHVSDFKDNADAIVSLIAGTIKVPKRILLGAEQGELASTQDRANFAERISDRREQFALPVILRPFINRLAGVGAIKLPQKPWWVKWPEIRNLDQKERSDVAAKLGKLNDKSKGVIVVTTDEIRATIGLEPLTDDQLKREAELAEQTATMAAPVAAPAADGAGSDNTNDPASPDIAPADKTGDGDTRDKQNAPRKKAKAARGLPATVLGEDIDWAEDRR